MRFFGLIAVIFGMISGGLLVTAQDVVDVSRFETVQVLGFGEVRDVAIHPDEKTLAIASRAGLSLYDLETLTPLKDLVWVRDGVNAVVWSADGSRLISAGGDGIIRVWGISRVGDEIHSREIYQIQSLPASIIALSPDGEYLALRGGVEYGAGVFEIWSLSESRHERIFNFMISDDKSIPTLDSQFATVISLAWSPDSRHLLSVNFEGDLRMWTMEANNSVSSQLVKANLNLVVQLTWSPDGRLIVADDWRSDEPLFLILDSTTWEIVNSIKVATDQANPRLTLAGWTETGKQFVTLSDQQVLRFWDVDTWQVNREVSLDGYGYFFDLSEHNLVTSNFFDSSVQLWDIVNGELQYEYLSTRGYWQHFAEWVSNERYILMAKDTPEDLSLVGLWDAETGALLDLLQLDNPLNDFDLSPNENLFVLSFWDKPSELWAIEINDTIQAEYLMEIDATQKAAWSPDGQSLATFNAGHIEIWQLEPDNRLTLKDSHDYLAEPRIEELFWSPDGNYLASAADKELWVWDVSSEGISLLWKKTYSYWLPTFNWSPDSRQLALPYSDNQWTFIQILDVATGSLLRQIPTLKREIHDFHFPQSLSWSPDSTFLAAGYHDGTIEIITTDESPQSTAFLDGHLYWGGDGGSIGEVVGLEWSADGTHLMSVSTDNTIHIWGIPD